MDSPLRSARVKRGLTLRQACALVELDISQLSRIERDGKTSRETAAKLAQFFKLTEEQVLFPDRFLRSKPRDKAA
jgi:transcriptional regulator with XRE-family HTH domain